MTMTNASRVGTGTMALAVRTENVRATTELLRRLQVDWATEVVAAVRSQPMPCQLAVKRVRSASLFKSPFMELAFATGSSRNMKTWFVPHDPFFAALYEAKELHKPLLDGGLHEWLDEAQRTRESQQAENLDRFSLSTRAWTLSTGRRGSRRRRR